MDTNADKDRFLSAYLNILLLEVPMSADQEATKKRTRRRLRVSCVECTRRRQVCTICEVLYVFVSDLRLPTRNATGSNPAVSAKPGMLSTYAAGSSSHSHVLYQVAHQLIRGPETNQTQARRRCKQRLRRPTAHLDYRKLRVLLLQRHPVQPDRARRD